MRLRGEPVAADRTYKVAGWAPVAEGAQGEPIWDLVARYLRDRKVVRPRTLEVPAIKGAAGNPGYAA
jgi:sulfur-oxidizing protein SoxB